MSAGLGKLAPSAAAWGLPPRPPGVHPLLRGATYAALECVCRKGAASPTFRGEYARARVGVLLAGAFHARGSQGAALLGAGTMLLGNPGATYEYRHVDDGGDRVLVFDYDEAALEDAGRAGHRRAPARRPFDGPCVPAAARHAAAVASAFDALCSLEPEAVHEAALAALDAALAAGAADGAALRPSPALERRVAASLRYIEAHLAGDCSLDALAARAGLSGFHFLRVFRALVRQTPRQFVIAARLRAAATELAATRRPVIEVAAAAGFGDLSHFNASFVRAFGVPPGAYRRRRGRA